MKRRSPLQQGVILALAAAAFVVALVALLRWIFGPEGAHNLAETLGGVGSAVATAFVALTLFLQSRELELQRRELELQRQELRETRQELEEHGAEFRRQGDLMAQQLTKDQPRLVAEFAHRGLTKFSLIFRNIGSSAVTAVKMRAVTSEGARRGDDRESLSPAQELEFLATSVPDGSPDMAVNSLRQLTQTIEVKFTDALRSPHRWVIATEDLAVGSKLFYPPEP